MIYKVFAVRDRAADVFGQPFFGLQQGAVIRSFGDEVKKPDSNLHAHPEDFDLYFLGEFDDSSGEFSTGRPSQIAIGKDYAA